MLKICDFGWSVSQMDDMRVTFCGTYEYMAPEIIDNVGYDKKVDIWSLGILFYELLHGFSPFRGDNPSIVFKNIKAGVLRFASDISPEAKQLISGILKKEPHLRLTIDEILASPLFQKYAQPASKPIPSHLADAGSKSSLQFEKKDWTARPPEEQSSFQPPAKDPAGVLPPRSQSRIYNLIEKKANASPVVVRLRPQDSSAEEVSAKSQFDDLLDMHKKEILGTNNPLKSYLSKNYDLASHNYQSQQDPPSGHYPPKQDFYSSNRQIVARESPGKLLLAQAQDAKPGRAPPSGPFQNSSINIGSSSRYLPHGVNPKLPASGPTHLSSNVNGSKSSLHQRNASYTVTTRVAQHTPISTRSRLDTSNNRSKSNRSIFEGDDLPAALADGGLEKPKNVGIKLDRHLKHKFEEIVKGHQPHSRSEAANVSRQRDDSREHLADSSAMYRPLLSRRAENGSRDGSVGRQADLSTSKVHNERSEHSLLQRNRDDSAEPRSYVAGNLPYISGHSISVLKQNSSNLFRDDRENSQSRIKRADKAPLQVANFRPDHSPTVVNKENSRYFSNHEISRPHQASRSQLDAIHAAAKPYVPYVSSQQYYHKPPLGRVDTTQAGGYLSTQLGRINSYQLSNN